MADDTKPTPGYGLLRGIAVLLMIVLVFGFWTLWRVYELRDCCERIEASLSSSESGEKGGPGPGPIISVGPRTGDGGTLTTSWKTGEGSSERDVTFGEAGYLREDIRTSAMKVEGRIGEWKVALDTATVHLSSGDVLVIDGSGTEVTWTWNGSTIAACNYDLTDSVHDCTNDGIPPEFDGALAASAIEFEPSTTAPDARAFVIPK